VRLVADVGGTNTRIALWDSGQAELRGLRVFRNQDYQRLEDVIAHWLAQSGVEVPGEACIAVAAAPAPADSRIHMLNIDWDFSCSDLSRRFSIPRVQWINDFSAIAFALPFLQDGDRKLLYPGATTCGGKQAVVGPGTGLGGATAELRGSQIHISPAEPGHMGLSPGSAMELEIFELLLTKHEYIYAELLVSGPGLQRIHRAICEIQGRHCEAINAAQISERAQTGSDSCCHAALELFCALLGSVCGDLNREAPVRAPLSHRRGDGVMTS
jgi:glucokinase